MLWTHTWQPHMGIIHGCNRTGLCHVDEYVCTRSVRSSSSLTHAHTRSLSHSLRFSLVAKEEEQTDNKWGGTLHSSFSPPSVTSSLRCTHPHLRPLLAHFLTPREQERSGSEQTRQIRIYNTKHFKLVSVLQVVSSGEFMWQSLLEDKDLRKAGRMLNERRRKWSAVDRWAEEWGQVNWERMKEVESGKAAVRSERWKISRCWDRGEKRGRVVPLESAGVAGKSHSRVLRWLSRSLSLTRVTPYLYCISIHLSQHKPPSENTELGRFAHTAFFPTSHVRTGAWITP